MDTSQVVLKLVLDALGQSVDLCCFDERLSIQKRIYLAQLTGADLGYRFSWYKYGPYCSELTQDAFRLREDLDRSDDEYKNDTLGPTALRLLEKACELWLHCPMNTSESDWLELLASLHYLKHIAYLRAKERDFERVFEALLKSKPKYSAREVEAKAAWEQLQRVGLIDHKVLQCA